VLIGRILNNHAIKPDHNLSLTATAFMMATEFKLCLATS